MAATKPSARSWRQSASRVSAARRWPQQSNWSACATARKCWPSSKPAEPVGRVAWTMPSNNGFPLKTRPSVASLVRPRSLSDLGSVGCNLTAAVHFSSASWPIAVAMSRRIRQKLSSLGPIFASTPQARQAPSPKAVRLSRNTNQNTFGLRYRSLAQAFDTSGRADLNEQHWAQPFRGNAQKICAFCVPLI